MTAVWWVVGVLVAVWAAVACVAMRVQRRRNALQASMDRHPAGRRTAYCDTCQRAYSFTAGQEAAARESHIYECPALRRAA